MIFVTGDVHGEVDFMKFHDFKERMEFNKTPLTKHDVIIVAGDFGIPWIRKETYIEHGYKITKDLQRAIDDEQKLIKYLDEYPCEILFVDGNHCNFDNLKELPEIDKYNSKVGKLSDNIFHLKRGNIYKIQNQNIFVFGGAKSIDKDRRTEFFSWWKEEIPTREEFFSAINNINEFQINNKIDHVISHTLPFTVLMRLNYILRIGIDDKLDDETTKMLDHLMSIIKSFKTWNCGHFHVSQRFEKFQLLYHDFVELKSDYYF